MAERAGATRKSAASTGSDPASDATSSGSSAAGIKKASDVDAAPPVGLLEFFKYVQGHERWVLLLGALGGIIGGSAMPMFSILLGGLFDDFNQSDPDLVLAAGEKYAGLFALVATGVAVVSFFQVACFTYVAERNTLRIRKLYLDAILKQEIAFFDKGSGELTARVAESTVIIREAMSEKLGMLFQFGSMFVVGFTVGFVVNWQLTLVVVSITPLLALGGYSMMQLMAAATSGSLDAYSVAGGVAEEAFGMITTVMAFGLEGRTAKRYETSLIKAENFGIKKSRDQGLGMALTMSTYFLSYALAFWYGAKLVISDKDASALLFPPHPADTFALCDTFAVTGALIDPATASTLGCFTGAYSENFTFNAAADVCACLGCDCGCIVTGGCVSGGDVVLVFFSVVIAAFSLGQAMPSISALNNGRAAAGKIFAILNRKPLIDASSTLGAKPAAVQGRITLENVTFRYPTRTEVPVFEGLDLTIEAGQTVALVGGSGCGKSTVTQLLQRFYDPEDGSVKLDGKDLRELNVMWLRENIGLVGQEPVLFATSIAKNIAMGCSDGHEPTQAEIEHAARAANAYDFITALPQGFDTFVGEGGGALSGGQKQRIAIARAMIRDPAILILDEATSALDNESERIVQAALDDLLKHKKRTTIVIAHRLSTVRNCDVIVVLGAGKGVLEQGTHESLVALPNGHYSALLAAAARSGDRRHTRRSQGKSEQEESEDEEEAQPIIASARRYSSKPNVSCAAVLPAGVSVHAITDGPESESAAPSKGCCGRGSGGKAAAPKEKLYSVPISRVFEFSRPEKLLYVPFLLAAMINGAQMPLFAVLFAGIANVYFLPTEELIQAEANKFALYFVAFSVVGALSNLGAFYLGGMIGEKMTTRVRAALFRSLLRQDMAFYDDKDNSIGALTSRLSTDAALIKASLTDRMALMVMNITTLFLGMAIAFYYGWQMTLVLIGLLPLIVISGAVQFLAMRGLANADEKLLRDASQILSESISGIRTVTAFALRARVVALYDLYLIPAMNNATRKGIVGGLGFGLSQGVMFVLYSVAFYYGSTLIVYHGYTFQDVLAVFFAVVMMGMGMGQTAAMAPDVAKSGVAVSNVYRILDRKCAIDSLSEVGAKGEAQTDQDIVLRNVDFVYPSRPDAKVFDQFNLTIKAGSTVALVGMSGSGKSTAIKLLERFYDADQGSVLFHGIDTKTANVAWLRSQFGAVQQEPNLYKASIYDNIAAGIPSAGEGDVPVPEEQIYAAAKAANVHEFIAGLPEGYNTIVSDSTLSGGQKQRVAIARCLIREPKVLLLDEATSALDQTSERYVQEAIDKMTAGAHTTSIIVAHRLSSIQGADLICVVHHGKIVETGSHDQLITKNGPYAKLYQSQKKR